MRHLLSTLVLCLLNIVFAEPEGDKDYNICIQCRKGPCGRKGPQGYPGPQGLTGPQGPHGRNGTSSIWNSLASFVNVYAEFPYTDIPDLGIIPMDQLQALSSPNDFIVDFSTELTQITVVQSGVYFITYNMAITDWPNLLDPVSVGVFKNGLPVPHCKYFATNSRLPIIGQCLIPITAGDVIEMRNLSGRTVRLYPADGEESTLIASKTSLMMVKVSNSTAMIVDEDL